MRSFQVRRELIRTFSFAASSSFVGAGGAAAGAGFAAGTDENARTDNGSRPEETFLTQANMPSYCAGSGGVLVGDDYLKNPLSPRKSIRCKIRLFFPKSATARRHSNSQSAHSSSSSLTRGEVGRTNRDINEQEEITP